MSVFDMGWRDILRPIRDGLRDNLPGPDHKKDRPSDEHLKRHFEDTLRGFAYFESFEEIDQWREDAVDPLQRSNTPLLPRPRSDVGYEKAPITVIHDQSGNYQPYEAVQGAAVDREYYACNYLQLIDRFIYFSHKVGSDWHQSSLQTLNAVPQACVHTPAVMDEYSASQWCSLTRDFHRRAWDS